MAAWAMNHHHSPGFLFLNRPVLCNCLPGSCNYAIWKNSIYFQLHLSKETFVYMWLKTTRLDGSRCVPNLRLYQRRNQLWPLLSYVNPANLHEITSSSRRTTFIRSVSVKLLNVFILLLVCFFFLRTKKNIWRSGSKMFHRVHPLIANCVCLPFSAE